MKTSKEKHTVQPASVCCSSSLWLQSSPLVFKCNNNYYRLKCRLTECLREFTPFLYGSPETMILKIQTRPTKDHFITKTWNAFDWRSESAVLNPTEHVLHILKKRLKAKSKASPETIPMSPDIYGVIHFRAHLMQICLFFHCTSNRMALFRLLTF